MSDELRGSEITVFAEDGGTVGALAYGDGAAGVVLVPGARYTKESWTPLAEHLVGAGFRVLAIDPRGQGASEAGERGMHGRQLDVRAAVSHLRERGCRKVGVVGASLGGATSLEAAREAGSGEPDALAVLSPAAAHGVERLALPVLFVCSAEEKLRVWVEALHGDTPEPKELLVLPGGEHAQRLLEGDPGAALRERLTRFLHERLT